MRALESSVSVIPESARGVVNPHLRRGHFGRESLIDEGRFCAGSRLRRRHRADFHERHTHATHMGGMPIGTKHDQQRGHPRWGPNSDFCLFVGPIPRQFADSMKLRVRRESPLSRFCHARANAPGELVPKAAGTARAANAQATPTLRGH